MMIALKKMIKFDMLEYRWNKINRHNQTTLGKIFDINKVSVGTNTYGPLNVYTYPDSNEKLIVGNYVSIANDVKFILGGNHRYDIFSTYPFKVKKLKATVCECYSNGQITIEDDVWIGMNSIILSGITVRKGAIIAAGSVVVKDVEAYSIVGGNPAKFIKYRFNKEIRNELKKINMGEFFEGKITDNIDILYKEVDLEVAREIVNSMNG